MEHTVDSNLKLNHSTLTCQALWAFSHLTTFILDTFTPDTHGATLYGFRVSGVHSTIKLHSIYIDVARQRNSREAIPKTRLHARRQVL